MCRRWPSSICSLLILTCLTACPGSDSGNGRDAGPAAAGSGGDAAAGDPDAGSSYDGDAGERPVDAGSEDAAQGGAGGRGDSDGGEAGSGSDGPNELADIEPAECRPDPTDFVACGGEITGKWRVASICLLSGVEDLRELWGCEELTQDFWYDYRMLIDFKSSGNYSAVVDAEAVQTVVLPFACLPEDEDCRTLLGDDDADASDGSTVIVKTVDKGCSIEAREAETQSEEGTWEVSGVELTMTNSTGPSTSDYCVSGDTLTVKNSNEVTGRVSWGVFERL
jgi:hypothetical protein